MSFQIAIDGPVAAGKGTVSRLVAERLGFLYIDTGAVYRAAALLASRNQLTTRASDEEKIIAIVKKTKIEVRKPKDDELDGRKITVLLNGEDVSWEIRQPSFSEAASDISELPKLRTLLTKLQQQYADKQNVVMEGRDITSVVLPHAQMKIYLTANDVIRAKRRHLELQVMGYDVSFSQVFADLLERDKQNITRTLNPLVQVPGVWVIDTSDLAIEDVVSIICESAAMELERIKQAPQKPKDTL